MGVLFGFLIDILGNNVIGQTAVILGIIRIYAVDIWIKIYLKTVK